MYRIKVSYFLRSNPDKVVWKYVEVDGEDMSAPVRKLTARVIFRGIMQDEGYSREGYFILSVVDVTGQPIDLQVKDVHQTMGGKIE